MRLSQAPRLAGQIPLGVGGSNPIARSNFRVDCPCPLGEAGGKRKGYFQGLGQGLNSGLAQSASQSYPNNDLADLSISGGSTRRVALTERYALSEHFPRLAVDPQLGEAP